jgi:hypothetical protein
MRFAVIATVAAAAVAVPLAVSAAGPQMSSDQFLSAVRCTAYEDITRVDEGLAEAKWQLNTEARRQPAETAALAQAEASAIARRVYSADAGDLTQEHAAACAGAYLATLADSPHDA